MPGAEIRPFQSVWRVNLRTVQRIGKELDECNGGQEDTAALNTHSDRSNEKKSRIC